MRRVEKEPCVYILASKRNGTLYVGVTSNLIQRVWQHKNNEVEGFTKKYQVHLLVYCEMHETMEFVRILINSATRSGIIRPVF